MESWVDGQVVFMEFRIKPSGSNRNVVGDVAGEAVGSVGCGGEDIFPKCNQFSTENAPKISKFSEKEPKKGV
jgi:hypothetical protein